MSKYSTTVLCECGCGLPAPLADKTTLARGYIQGRPRRFRAHHYRPEPSKKDYRRKSRREHPRATQGCIAEHVLIAEAALGRYLPTGAEVHHVDGDRTNNIQSNLVICQDKGYHKLLHVRARVLRAGGDPNMQRICSRCRTLKPFEAFNRATRNRAYGLQQMCRQCQSEYCKTYRRNGVAA